MTTGTDDSEEQDLAEAGVGVGECWRGVKSKCLSTRIRKSEREVGRSCLTNTQTRREGGSGPRLPHEHADETKKKGEKPIFPGPQRGQAGRFIADDMDKTSTLTRIDG